MKNLLHNNDAVAAIEFALIVPMLLLILTGMVDYGMYANEKLQAQELSRRAAEYVVHGGQESDVRVHIIDTSEFYTKNVINRTSVTYNGQTDCECANGVIATSCTALCNDDDYLRSFFAVTITAVYTPFLPYPGIADGITLTGYSRLQYAR